jgi:DNA invertase Pin-like site-specific DNA recombinase
MKIGFARVSKADLNLDNQVKKLEEAGCEQIYTEVVSGSKKLSQRPELQNMLKALRPNDICCAVRIDRLSRSLTQLLSTAKIIRDKGAHLQFLDQSIDTTTPSGELIFNILGSLAQFELELIRSRTKDGLERAKSEGKKLGRIKSTSNDQDRKIKSRWKAGESWNEIAEDYGISRQSVYRRIKKWREEESTEELEAAVWDEDPPSQSSD